MKNVVISGVLVTLISAITIGSFDTYSQIKANTEHRLESKEDKIMNRNKNKSSIFNEKIP
jgi:hypothetical protein